MARATDRRWSNEGAAPPAASRRERRRRFCREYLVDHDGKAAAIRAGFPEKGAAVQACRMLKDERIQAEISRIATDVAERVEVTVEHTLGEIARRAYYDPGEIASAGISEPADIRKLSRALRSCIEGWDYDAAGHFRLKLAKRHEALALLAKHLGLIDDRLQVKGDLTIEVRRFFIDPPEARPQIANGGNGYANGNGHANREATGA